MKRLLIIGAGFAAMYAATSAARLRSGDRVTLRLRPWADVSDRYEKINRSEIDDPSIQLEEPCWGEPVTN